ncbi:MAG: 30S ribosomal protein S17 [Thermoplasmata archaeon HGW-Thermoplasmata-1]|nr:MAG: 30S ribosomal protein S17 [Thermoplasmata archaeon HGW-Thermoplasmata-1]
MAEQKPARDIGINVRAPTESCRDPDCPFHGTLSVRGHMIVGTVKNSKMQNSVIVEKEQMHYVQKYERYEKRTSSYAAHCPPCIKVGAGDEVRIMECRPLSKTISFVVVERKEKSESAQPGQEE